MTYKLIIPALLATLPFAASAQLSATAEPISQTQFIHAAENTVNGVVSVKSFTTPGRGMQGQVFGDPIFEYFFGTPRQSAPRQQAEPRQTGLGSGVILSEDGYIVTNNHVIEGAERLEVTLNDNRNYEATVVGADPVTDVALLKIEADSLHAIPVGDSEGLRVGEWVLAVGNPFGFTSTVTSGIVSAKARSISGSTGAMPSRGIESFIQTDAALNSGNSGGALVNLAGELVGINTAIYSQTGTYAGCSFAIPTTIVSKVVADLKAYGMVQRAVLGVSYVALTPEIIAQENISGVNSGILLARVEPGSAADEAGLKENDVIVALGSAPTLNSAQMQEAISRFSPGDTTEIHYYRDGRRLSTTATLRNSRGDTGTVTAPAVDLGATFAPVEARTASRLRINGGVMVSEVDPRGLLGANGVRPGFIILAVNNIIVADRAQLEQIVSDASEADNRNDRVLFISGVYPTGKMAYYAVPLAD